MVQVLTENVSPRLDYVLDLIFNEVLDSSFTLYTDKKEFEKLSGIKIYYGNEFREDCINISSTGLLFEAGVRNLDLSPEMGTLPFVFRTEGKEFPFDLLSAIFYMTTRYEEYLPFKGDKLGRYEASSSVLHDLKAISRPLVNEYIDLLKSKIELRFHYSFKQKKYRFIPTHDIDMAFAYKGRTLSRTIGGFAKSFAEGDMNKALDRLKVLRGDMTDPFDTFDYLETINIKYGLSPVYFYQVGNHGKLDKNVDIENDDFKEIVRGTSVKYKTGLHPSFFSNQAPDIVREEKKKLESLTGQQIIRSRQHFLKLSFPETFLRLESLGIVEEYSLGYPETPGFRAGICTPFFMFDLKKDRKMKVKLFPLQVMDTTFNNYLGKTPEEAESIISELILKVKSVKGTFVTLWHNNSLSDYNEWRGWKPLYESIVSKAKE